MKNIIVINGPEGEDSPRLEKALDIYKQGDSLIACKFDKATLDSVLGDVGYIDVERVPRDTFENAYFSSHYVTPKKDVVLVTSGYHMDRASYIFEKILKKPVKKAPVRVDGFKRHRALEKLQKAYSACVLMFEPTEAQYARYRNAIEPLYNVARALKYKTK